MPVRYDLYMSTPSRAGDIPMRLTHLERKYMRLVRGVINASNYTDRVDSVAMLAHPGKRLAIQLREIFNVCVGFVTGIDEKKGMQLLSDNNLEKYAQTLQVLFEVTRRYKILNPDLMRTDYAKVIYLLQDSVIPEISSELGFTLVTDVRTVRQYCQAKGIEALLDDDQLPLCTTPVPAIRDRTSLNKALRYKDLAVQALSRKYAGGGVTQEQVEIAIYSLADANQYATDNAACVKRMISVVQTLFNPDTIERPEFDLGINEGAGGSRLTHAHKEQYYFVLQTMAFWKNILMEMFSLWTIAEREMLDGSVPYAYEDTGQGYHRLQRGSAETRKALVHVLEQTKAELKGVWIGSDRIHLGDPQVPNGMYFLDKYAQISRIVNPILKVLEFVDGIADGRLNTYIKTTWKSPEYLKKVIITDFLRHGFDGSGGDNMDDAGSCIDGRLTSAWNWCNEIHSKPYYPVFLLAGFHSFDGDLNT
eukprot:PhF_6_TR42158/c0_g1_i1/m.63714